MREKINELVKEEIDKLNVSISDVNIEKVEGKNVLNIELDCEETIDGVLTKFSPRYTEERIIPYPILSILNVIC